MEPASKIVSALGGASKVASIAGVHRTRVYGWMKPKVEGGTGGIIPFPHIGKIIAGAAKQGIRLTGDDFLPSEVVAMDHPPAHGPAIATAQGRNPENSTQRKARRAVAKAAGGRG